MRHSTHPPRPLCGLILASLFLLITLDGCGTTPASAPPASVARIGEPASQLPLLASGKGALDPFWPNDDQRFWEYRLEQFPSPVEVAIYGSYEEVPAAPTVWELAAQLRSESRRASDASSGGAVDAARYRLQFDGQLTTKSGAQGQNLTEELLADVLPQRARTAAAPRALSDLSLPAFWSHLAAARPDLAGAVRARLGRPVPGTLAIDGRPILLHGGAFEKTADHIGTYGDLNQQIAWLYLKGDAQAGTTFELQLIPELADDLWLRALVLPRRFTSRPRPAPGAVEVLYLIDYGVSAATSSTGEFLGAFRALEYGTVTYAPEVGPVAAFDRFLYPGYGIETRATLTSTGPEAAPLLGQLQQ